MKLKSVVGYFDTCPVYDAYTGALLFKIQTSTFLESSAEGSTAARRVVSLNPDLSVPAHNCILALGQIWIVGASNPDEWKGAAIRKAYWTKLATDNMKLLTPGQAAASAPGLNLFGSKKYLRESLNNPTDSELDAVWEVSVSANTIVSRGYFLKSANTLYRVRVDYKDLDGFYTCQVDEVDEPVTSIYFNGSSAYNPITDSYTPTHLTLTAIILDYSKAYSKSSVVATKSEVGDIALVIAKSSTTPKTSQQFEVPTGRFKGSWRVLSALEEHDAWKIHARRL